MRYKKKMKYFGNDFYPAWVPEEMRPFINLSELAEPTIQIIEEANSLMEKLGVNIAVYRSMPRGKPNGLCTFFKAAILQSEQLKILNKTERRLKDYVVVAYANPLQQQNKKIDWRQWFVLFCWSGGKDSALALYEIMNSGSHSVMALLTTVTEDYDRISMHGVRTALLEQQAKALNLPLEKVFISKQSSNEDYEEKMTKVLKHFKNGGTYSVGFGDIFLEDLRKYRENNLAKLQMNAIFPLWKKDSKQLANSFIDLGFKAIITCVDTKFLDASFTGREFNKTFLSDLPSSVDPSGENGEFHTFVYAGPLFDREISVTRGEIVLKDERFCFCDLLPTRG
jgi:uncharacterized protein (TIGR00290 family)